MDSLVTPLKLFKTALGITHDKRDEYFMQMLSSRVEELKGRGVSLSSSSYEDVMLLVDYTEFCYRNRDGNVEMPRNLDLRIRNKQVQGRAT